MNSNLLGRYIIALTNLYGIVPEKKVVEIYNLYNTPDANLGDLEISVAQSNLPMKLITRRAGYFLKDYLIFEDRFLDILRLQEGTEYYIPERNELLMYEDEFWFKQSKIFHDFNESLWDYFELDYRRHKHITELLLMDCQLGLDIKEIMEELSRNKLEFDSVEDMNIFMRRFQKLCRNTRKWQYKGHTYNELNSGNRFKFAKGKLKKIFSLQKS
ncbi:MAG: hypothetical protein RBT15_03985 [Gudongella sp.]|jgi:hypothetical protein|nr:hypothetical protein [Gudongella sp.]